MEIIDYVVTRCVIVGRAELYLDIVMLAETSTLVGDM